MSATRPRSRPSAALLLEAEGDIVLDGQVREQRIGLEHHVGRPPIGRHAREILAVEQDVAGIRPLETGDHPQQRGLAAPGRSEQREELAGINVERQPIDGGESAEALGQTIDTQQRTRIALGRQSGTLSRSDRMHRFPNDGARHDRACPGAIPSAYSAIVRSESPHAGGDKMRQR